MGKYFTLNIEDELELVIPEFTMAEELFNLIDSDREHLRTFLDFVDDSLDAEAQREYLKIKILGSANRTDKLYFIALKNKLVGCIDLHHINTVSGKAEIGYWLHSQYKGQGNITKAVKVLCKYSFDVLGLNKISLLADVENAASNKVALRSGFKLLGTRLEDGIMNNQYRDINEYYLLKSDFCHLNS